MKVQSLGIIFIIIVLPITILLGEYANAQILTFEMQQQYDSRLITATYDALKAFQINTFNDTGSDIVDTKLTSIEASANAFYNSMESAFDMEGYGKEDMHNYTPALVYTMYDGYYIYSPYNNIADTKDKDEVTGNSTADAGDDIIIEDKPSHETVIDLTPEEDEEYGFKPYVYYSCRYKVGTDSDFVIAYTLDNYISVQGTIQGNYVKKSGYLITLGTSTTAGLYEDVGKYYYDGVEILSKEDALEENILEEESTAAIKYKYIKLNGTKYYWDQTEKEIFHLVNGTRTLQVKDNMYDANDDYDKMVTLIDQNNSGKMYYKNAYEFTNWVNTNTVLSNLTFEDWVNQNRKNK